MKIGYVFTEIPDVAGAFPGAELEEMAARGLTIELFVLRSREQDSAEARRLADRFVVHRSPYLLSLGLMADCFSMIARHPVLFLQTIVRTVRDARTSPMLLVKSLGILPKAIHFAAIARRRNVSLLHGYWASLPALAAGIMARFAGLSYTTWAHAGADIYQRGYQTDDALRSRLREARRVLTCHRANLDHFAGLVDPVVMRKVVLMTHGVDVERFHQVPERAGTADPATPKAKPSPPVLLAIGKFVPGKGMGVLLEACRLLRQRRHTFECMIVGSGRLEASLRELAIRCGLADVVDFLGNLPHERVAALYHEVDVFVMPSVIAPDGSRDGLPNVLLEAMASGLPCVGSRTSSIPEAIEDGRTGLLVPPGDPEALAAAIERLFADPALRRALGDAAARKVRAEYARGPAMDRLHALFMELLREGAWPAGTVPLDNRVVDGAAPPGGTASAGESEGVDGAAPVLGPARARQGS